MSDEKKKAITPKIKNLDYKTRNVILKAEVYLSKKLAENGSGTH